MIPRLYTIEEAAEALRLSRGGLLRIINAGHIPVIKYPASGERAARLAIREDALVKFLQAHERTGSAVRNGPKE